MSEPFWIQRNIVSLGDRCLESSALYWTCIHPNRIPKFVLVQPLGLIQIFDLRFDLI